MPYCAFSHLFQTKHHPTNSSATAIFLELKTVVFFNYASLGQLAFDRPRVFFFGSFWDNDIVTSKSETDTG